MTSNISDTLSSFTTGYESCGFSVAAVSDAIADAKIPTNTKNLHIESYFELLQRIEAACRPGRSTTMLRDWE
eukprot:1177077-Prorocentrum_minimum.AAC.4